MLTPWWTILAPQRPAERRLASPRARLAAACLAAAMLAAAACVTLPQEDSDTRESSGGQEGLTPDSAEAAIGVGVADGTTSPTISAGEMAPADASEQTPSVSRPPRQAADGTAAAVSAGTADNALPEDKPDSPADEAPIGVPDASPPGEPIQAGPDAGDVLAVVGVSHSGVLNVRDAPAGEVVATLDPVVSGLEEIGPTLVTAVGETRMASDAVWHRISFDGATGWASAAHLASLGAEDDPVDSVIAALGRLPTAQTLPDLAAAAANALGYPAPPESLVVSGLLPPRDGVAYLAVDVLGVEDDAVRGFRLMLWAAVELDAMSGDTLQGPFTLGGIRRVTLCDSSRGAAVEGLCH